MSTKFPDEGQFARRRAAQTAGKNPIWFEGLPKNAVSNMPERAKDQQRSQSQRRRDDDDATSNG